MGRAAVVMSGGGAKGAFELGAADYLIRDHGVNPDVLVGVSTGNLNAAMLAQGKGREGLIEKLDRLCALWFGLRENRDIYTKRFLGYAGLALKADSVYSNEPLQKLISRYVSRTELAVSGRLLRVGVVGLKSGRYEVIDGRDPRILEMILASTAIPVFFTPVDIGSERYVDGGVRNVTPLNTAFDALAELEANEPGPDNSPDTMYVILASPLAASPVADDEALDSGIDIAKRALELLVNEIYANDLQLAVTVNESLRFFDRLRSSGTAPEDGFPFAGRRYVNMVLIQPDRLYMDGLEFDHDQILAAFEGGRRLAKQAVEEAAQQNGSNISRAALETTA